MVNGDLFEKGRFPILSIFVFIGSLRLERLIAAVQTLGIGLAAIAVGRLMHYLYHLNGKFKGAGALWLVVLIPFVSPGLVDRGRYAAGSYHRALENKREYLGHHSEFRPVAEYIQKTIRGRLFAGSKAGWGSEYKIGQVPVYLLFMTQPRPPVLGYMPFTWSLACDFSSYVYQYRPAYDDLFNVEYLLAPTEIKPATFFQPVVSSGRHHLYKIKTRGYFHLVETPGLVFADKYTFWKFNQLWLKSRLVEQNAFFVIDFKKESDSGQDIRLYHAIIRFLIYDQARKKLFDSGRIGRHGLPYSFSIDITDVDALSFIVNDGGDGIHSDHANWADVMLYP